MSVSVLLAPLVDLLNLLELLCISFNDLIIFNTNISFRDCIIKHQFCIVAPIGILNIVYIAAAHMTYSDQS